MPHSLPALTFVLALHSFEVAASTPEVMLARGDNGNGNGSSSATTSTSTSTTTDISTTHSSSTSTTHSSSTSTHSSSTSTTQSSSASTTQSSSPSITQSSSISITANTVTLTSSSSGYARTTGTSSSSSTQNNQYGSTLTSTSSQGLSTAARTGLAFGIMFFLILSAMLFCYLKRRSRRARAKASEGPAHLSAEVSQYRPPNPVTSPERELPPPLRVNPNRRNPSNISRSTRHSARSSIAPLLSDDFSRNSHPASTLDHYSTLSHATDTRPVTTQDVPPLPNPHDTFSAPTGSASYASNMMTTAASPPHSNAYNASVLTSTAMTGTIAAPVASSSSSQPGRRRSALHTDLARHQKQLELEHRKRLETQEELQEPPPEYSS
ncbi:uncharacterized protein EDB91DRAFT_568257 [Suillus paluster]|uniref:uncharacterized protein n=1 Tax=Suillus paluster TaxID=48578 RepID=UPI001B885686|nr:uncharacterized protein EDB91DRAFT_568257 [Suillus paluster]KAG1735093.1 hypothetical protein EDB91DRAFT_568257 [Suillus paluster]